MERKIVIRETLMRGIAASLMPQQKKNSFPFAKEFLINNDKAQPFVTVSSNYWSSGKRFSLSLHVSNMDFPFCFSHDITFSLSTKWSLGWLFDFICDTHFLSVLYRVICPTTHFLVSVRSERASSMFFVELVGL